MLIGRLQAADAEEFFGVEKNLILQELQILAAGTHAFQGKRVDRFPTKLF